MASPSTEDGLPKIRRTFSMDAETLSDQPFQAWVKKLGKSPCWWTIGSVNREHQAALRKTVGQLRPQDRFHFLAVDDLPIESDESMPRSEIGIDRLLDALAADQLRRKGRPAIIIDLGSAVTIDLVSRDGVFRGGTILPGLGMSAQAMHEFTDRLPLLSAEELLDGTSIPTVGHSTFEAMRSGLLWGMIGAVDRVIKEMTRQNKLVTPELFVTGGGASTVVKELGRKAVCCPDLILQAIASMV